MLALNLQLHALTAPARAPTAAVRPLSPNRAAGNADEPRALRPILDAATHALDRLD